MKDCFYICTSNFTITITMDFVNRLKFFMDSHGIAISQFADTCRIPRPTLSQILNGRNKKISDELIAKIHAAYPRLSVLWLMFGEGEMESATNMQFSEPQNQGSEAVSMPYSAINQPIQNPNDGPDSVTENQSENSASVFGGDNSLFSGQNLAPTQVAAQNQTADAPGSDRQPGFDDSLHGSIHFYNEIPDRPMRAPQPELYPQSGNIDTPFMTADHDDGHTTKPPTRQRQLSPPHPAPPWTEQPWMPPSTKAPKHRCAPRYRYRAAAAFRSTHPATKKSRIS